MTFPEVPYGDIALFYEAYSAKLSTAMASVDREALRAAALILDGVYARGGTLYIAGNGGSAAIANTFVCDHAKLVQTDTDLKPRVISLAGNVPMMTAIANDISYDDVFVYQLQTYGRADDALVLISASGSSPNIVKAAEWARANDVDVVAFTGFDGGKMKDLATVNLHVDADNYGVIEDCHQSLMHSLAQFIRLQRMDEGLVRDRKF